MRAPTRQLARWFFWIFGGIVVLALAVMLVVGTLFFRVKAELGDGRWLILLQNTDELRATGGFMGSYTVLDLGSEHPLDFTLRDIYDPSGVSITLPSPAGQAEYLSEGQGMKLVDANWDPDFPQTAQRILSYFESIPNDPQSYDGVIAVPLSVVERVVALLGGIYVADLNRTVSADELAMLLRSNRGEFFSGSQEKTQVLQQFATALFLKLEGLPLSEWVRLLRTLVQEEQVAQLQAYSTDERVQQQLAEMGLDGALASYDDDAFFLFPVESNVGINKANRFVTRRLALTFDQQEPDSLIVKTEFRNSATAADRPAPAPNQAEHLAYANYYRLLMRPEMTVSSIAVGGTPVTRWDEEVLMGSNGLPYRQVGFLMIVPEDATATAQIRLHAPGLYGAPLLVQQQVGASYEPGYFVCEHSATPDTQSFSWQMRLATVSCPQAVQ